MRQGEGQVGCLLSTLGLALGGPLLLVGLRIAANEGELAGRRAGKAEIVQARKDAAAKRGAALRPLTEQLQALRLETQRANRAVTALEAGVASRRQRMGALASQFKQLPGGVGLTLAAVQGADTLDEAIALMVSAQLSDRGRPLPRAGAAECPYPLGTPANTKLLDLFRQRGIAGAKERGRLSAELRGLREKRVSGVLAECAPLSDGSGRGLTLTLSDQLSPRAREVLVERFRPVKRLLESDWIQACFLKKTSHPELLPVSPETLAVALRSEFSGEGPLRSLDQIKVSYADTFSFEFENESPQTIEIQVAEYTLRLDPYLWKAVALPPGRHIATGRSLKDEDVRPVSFEVKGVAGDRLSTRIEIMRAPPEDPKDSASDRK